MSITQQSAAAAVVKTRGLRRTSHLRRVLLGGTLIGAAMLSLVSASPIAQAAGTFTVTANLDGRTVTDLNNHAVVNKYPAGSSVAISCQATGPNAYGSTVWDFTSDQLWITDYYVRTGFSGFDPNLPRCDNPVGSAGGSGQYLTSTTLDGRTAKDLSNHAFPNKYPSGSAITLACQDSGPVAYSSQVWDKTSDGLWVPDAYVRTGYSGFSPVISRCSAPASGSGKTFQVTATLDGRTVKDLANHAVPNKYSAGSFVTVKCQDAGGYAYGSVVWDQTGDSLWIPDHYVKTGYDDFAPELPRCVDPISTTQVTFPVTATLDGRTAKDLSNHAYPNKYAAGTNVTITCQAYGPYAYGSALWDKTTDGLWVADYYVKTGASGFLLGMPRCDNDQPSGTPPAQPATNLPAAPSAPVSNAGAAIVAAARSQLGTKETGDNCNPYGVNGTVCGAPWCSIFASWTWRQAGVQVYYPYSGNFVNLYGGSRGTVIGSRAKDSRGKWTGTPVGFENVQPGDVVLYGIGPGFSGNHPDSDHVGVVETVLADGRITTIEGNWSNQVTRRGPFDPKSASDPARIFAIVAP